MITLEQTLQRRELSDIVERFEQAWLSGSRPRIQDYLDHNSIPRILLLTELVHTDLEYQVKAGNVVRVEDYLQQFGELRNDSETVVELIEAEYKSHRNYGRQPNHEDYLKRFPKYADELRDLLSEAGVETEIGQEPAKYSPIELPQQLNNYRFGKIIGEGGMGLIVRIQDENFQRSLAMKVIRAEYAHQADVKERFYNEAQLTGRLQHPGIPPVYEKGQLEDGRPYFVMKLVKGESLSSLLKKRSSPDQDLPYFIGVFEQVCQTLAYAHSRNVIHRDIKPANIMVGAYGEVQVMDWGLAKITSSKPESRSTTGEEFGVTMFKRPQHRLQENEHTSVGTIMGTPTYMPPEQARGEVEHIDQCSDVFGLGALFCEVLTGTPAFAARNQDENYQYSLNGDVSDAYARLENCGADSELTSIAKCCLSPEKSERFTDAAALAREIAEYQNLVEERLKKAEREKAAAKAKAGEEKKRRRLMFRVAVMIVFGLIVIFGLLVFSMVQKRMVDQNAIVLVAQTEQALRQAEDDLLTIKTGIVQDLAMIDILNSKLNSQQLELDLREKLLRVKSKAFAVLGKTTMQELLDRQHEAHLLQLAMHKNRARLIEIKNRDFLLEEDIAKTKIKMMNAKLNLARQSTGGFLNISSSVQFKLLQTAEASAALEYAKLSRKKLDIESKGQKKLIEEKKKLISLLIKTQNSTNAYLNIAKDAIEIGSPRFSRLDIDQVLIMQEVFLRARRSAEIELDTLNKSDYGALIRLVDEETRLAEKRLQSLKK